MPWAAASQLRSNIDAAEYKHVALGLLFLKHVSDKFEYHRAKLETFAPDERATTSCPPTPPDR
jgi:type I restriction enzyme M protein